MSLKKHDDQRLFLEGKLTLILKLLRKVIKFSDKNKTYFAWIAESLQINIKAWRN